jgi:hypothetical protein
MRTVDQIVPETTHSELRPSQSPLEEFLETERAMLTKRREFLLTYLDQVVRAEEDWHGVMDAAADLREIDAKLELIAECQQ